MAKKIVFTEYHPNAKDPPSHISPRVFSCESMKGGEPAAVPVPP